MDFFALIGAVLDIIFDLGVGGSRVTVKDRYAMKKKVRELRKQERLRKRKT